MGVTGPAVPVADGTFYFLAIKMILRRYVTRNSNITLRSQRTLQKTFSHYN